MRSTASDMAWAGLHSVARRSACLVALIVLAGGSPAPALAQDPPAYKVGDRVEADINMSSSPDRAKWRKATITRIDIWQGRVSGIFVKTDEGAELALGAAHLRPSSGEDQKPAPSAPVQAQPSATSSTADKGSGACQMGARVVDRSNRAGTVVEARGPDCRVRLADGSVKYYLAWMLSPAGGDTQPGAGVASPTRGTYHCVAAGGIAGTLQLVIKDDTHYADRNGKTGEYGHDPKTHRLVFRTGPWEGYYGGILGPRKIGLSSRPGGSFNTVCDLK